MSAPDEKISRRPAARPSPRPTIALTLVVVLGACSGGGEAPGTSDTGGASAQLATVVDEVWNRTIERSPFLRLREGLRVRVKKP